MTVSVNVVEDARFGAESFGLWELGLGIRKCYDAGCTVQHAVRLRSLPVLIKVYLQHGA